MPDTDLLLQQTTGVRLFSARQPCGDARSVIEMICFKSEVIVKKGF